MEKMAKVVHLFADKSVPKQVHEELSLDRLLSASIELELFRKREKQLVAFFDVWDRYVANDVSVTKHDVARAAAVVKGMGVKP